MGLLSLFPHILPFDLVDQATSFFVLINLSCS